MISVRSLAITISWVVLAAAPLIYSQDLKPYEEKMALLPLPVTLELQSQDFLWGYM